MAADKTNPEATSEESDEQTSGAEENTEEQESEQSSEETSENDESQDKDEAPAPAKKESKRERRRREAAEQAEAEPKDRNERLRKKLLKKKAEADAPAPLTAGEIVDDAFARGVHALGKWVVKNSVMLQYIVFAAMVGGIGYYGWSWYRQGKIETSSTEIGRALAAERGRVTDSSKTDDDVQVFPNAAAKLEAGVAAYRKAETTNPGSGAAILAKIGAAGILLDQKKFDEALTAYRDVKSSPLAAADQEIRARAIEGIGFALEGKGDSDAAQKAFKELETLSAKGMKPLGLYHQARLLAAKGDKQGAVALITSARADVKTAAGSLSYLSTAIDELHRRVDPASAPARTNNKQMTPEEFMRLQEQLKKAMEGQSNE